MSYYRHIPAPGTEFGPCADACNHRACAVARDDAAKVCPICLKTIGYDTTCCTDDGQLSHQECVLDKYDY
jgi:hypothetical protein